MKSFLYFLFLTSALSWSQDTASKGATLTVTLENVLNDQGEILAALHSEETFMKGRGIASYMGEAQKGRMVFTFENVVPGTYAITVLHDMNSNLRMDYQSNGMPDEPYGMSGNDMAMGPPSFEATRFEVHAADQEITIRF